MRLRAFTLIELLVVVAIIALLISILLPSLSAARRQGRVVKCLTNLRALGVAHGIYMDQHAGRLIDAGLAHGGSTGLDERNSWIFTLEAEYGSELVRRSPLDDSPHWPTAAGGQNVPVPGRGADEYPFRRTSYGLNNLLSRSIAPVNPRTGRRYEYDRIDRIPRPAVTAHLLFMAKEGEFAGSDHPHIENWNLAGLAQLTPRLASAEVQLNAVDGVADSYDARSNWGFLDGHAEAARFRKLWFALDANRFWPEAAQ